jgi:uncharacterized protein (DUF736 family)
MQIGLIALKGKHYEGRITTLALDFEFTLEPNANRREKAPDFRVMDGGGRERGYAYRESFESESDGRTVQYLSIKFDDPTFAHPIYAKAYLGERDEFPVTWNRPKKKAA